jgi:periplasmic protein CpxP/Spy
MMGNSPVYSRGKVIMMYREPLFAAALFASTAVLGLAPALAQPAAAPSGSAVSQTQEHRHAGSRMMPGQLVDGRIAFLQAELKITPQQEAQWQSVVAAMRQNANALDQVISSARQQRGAMDAVQHLTMREQFDKVRAENDERLLSAFQPLYRSLSPEQQQIANQLLFSHHGWHRHTA